jgi:radical SAM-linked protein
MDISVPPETTAETTDSKFDSILSRVERPSRYIGGEVNSIIKKGEASALRFALAFPDVYEVGMSHLGIQILYSILNSRSDIAAERFFAPWPDLEEKLREADVPLCSLESRTPLGEFDIIGFSLQYELSYTNVLNMLELGGVPLRTRDRKGSCPIVIAGGPCAFNPAPMADFIDAFAIGEGEEIITEIAAAVLAAKRKGLDREKILEELARMEGIYVPALDRGKVVRKRTVPDLDAWRFPLNPMVPLARAVHDRINLEIARGCTRGCRFCQAGMVWRPLRERSQSVLEDMARDMISSTGYEEISLLSLSTGDYSRVEELLCSLMNSYCSQRIAVSLPSLRTETLTGGLIEQVRRVRKTSFTLAPEAGTERLRRIINKGNTEEDLITAAEKVFSAGWRAIKLYFMLGLPGETQDDLDGIIDLAGKVARAGRNRRQVTVSVSSFVPKPHTPFQWERQIGVDEIRERQAYLKKSLRNRSIAFKWHAAEMSLLEGIFSRGDEKLGALIEEAFRRGARFDGWTEYFNPALWDAAMASCGIEAETYLRERALSDALPWENIDCGVSREFLIAEREKATLAEATADCRKAGCTGCGVCGDVLGISESKPADPGKSAAMPAGGAAAKYRIFYTKKGRARFISHLETASVLIRALRRSGVAFNFSNGYHPHPKISFVFALPVGVESECECAEIEISGQAPDAAGINGSLPEGMEILSVEGFASPISAGISGFRYSFRLAPEMAGPAKMKIEEFRKAPEFLITRKSKQKEAARDIRPLVQDISLAGHTLEASLAISAGGGVRPSEVLTGILGISPEQAESVLIRKTRILYKSDQLTGAVND